LKHSPGIFLRRFGQDKFEKPENLEKFKAKLKMHLSQQEAKSKSNSKKRKNKK
jgi:hypothetical protein